MSSRHIASSTGRGAAGTRLVIVAAGGPLRIAGAADRPTITVVPVASAIR